MKHFFKSVKEFAKKNKRFIPLVIIALVLLATFLTFGRAAINGNDPPDESTTIEETPSESLEPEPTTPEPTTPEPTETPDPTTLEPTETPEPEPTIPNKSPDGPANPLTGLPLAEDAVGKKPKAIMLDNVKVAMPHLGVSKADIIYEVPVEGAYTRMMAVFQDVSEAGVIGGVRSSRHYFIDIAQSYDAVYIFAGGSPQAYDALAARSITRLDGTNGQHREIFYRDQQRANKIGAVHSYVTSSELIAKWLPTYNNFKLDHDAGYKSELSFTEDGTPSGGVTAQDFSVKLTSIKSTSFKYNSDDKYEVSQHGGAYIDGNSGIQIAVTNVLIIKTSISGIPGDKEGRLNVTTTGSGTGHFVCGGKAIEIKWSKPTSTSQFSYTLTDGTPLQLGQGKTFICVVPKESNVEFK